ncbi:cytochrome c-type biogenesis protein CcmH [Yoonia litorea]|uniref:Cytochrome c-type biogenesis protein CcmH n=2 Tax=Yoonia litorea TaxID=1123755 RepID=A0A1I6LUS8_9RHOB|nr:cytochrome c-type biogenesis protein CcmH [Yoonia litorea]
MVFWTVCALLAVAVTAMIVTPLLRPQDVPDENPDVAIYRAQLDEIDKDLERGLLEADEAERARAEVARRLIAANKEASPQAGQGGPTKGLSLVIGLTLLAVTFGVYWTSGAPGYGDLPLQARLAASDEMRANRPDQAALEAVAPTPPQNDLPADYVAAIEQLREIAPTRPDDLEAWERLAFHEVEMRNYAAAVDAQQQVIAIKGDEALLTDYQRLLDLKVVAAGGLVSPEAEELIREILVRDDGNIAARYYLGALYNQTDRPDIALRLWRTIIEGGDPQNFHVASARAQASDAAFRAGVEYALPETRGPTFEQMEQAQEMSPEDQQAMIGGMVAGLADRLATEGGPAQDWARLIRAYGVLGDLESARTVWNEAQQVFVSSMRGMEILTNAARDAGVLDE